MIIHVPHETLEQLAHDAQGRAERFKSEPYALANMLAEKPAMFSWNSAMPPLWAVLTGFVVLYVAFLMWCAL